MADIDVEALKQFQKQWGPVLDAIPAVLDMAERKADLDRAMAKYANDAEKVRKAAEKDQADAAASLAGIQAEIDAAKAQKADWVQELADFRKEAEAERVAAEKAAADLVATSAQRAAEINASIAGLEAEYAIKRQTLEDAHNALIASKSAEIEAMDATRVKTEKALDALRAKLG